MITKVVNTRAKDFHERDASLRVGDFFNHDNSLIFNNPSGKIIGHNFGSRSIRSVLKRVAGRAGLNTLNGSQVYKLKCF